MADVTNVEIKARADNVDALHAALEAVSDLHGVDEQLDVYFRAPASATARLKVRVGNIESALICYERSSESGSARPSHVRVARLSAADARAVAAALELACGPPLARVHKRRMIRYAGNVKLHVDRLFRDEHHHAAATAAATGDDDDDDDGMRFVEIEAAGGRHEEARLREQCEQMMHRLGIRDDQLIALSYADMFT